MADATAAADVIFAQVARYTDLPREVGGLADLCSTPPAGYADRGRKFGWRDGVVVCAFGNKHKGRALKAIVEQDPSYLQWILSNDFPDDTKLIVREALEGRYPIELTSGASGESGVLG
jgi:DNA polymerase-3 subunit epsilon